LLLGRKQRDRVGGQLSEEVRLSSGVSQGSVLGPLLFLQYVNDIWKNTESTIRHFAEDFIIYRKIIGVRRLLVRASVVPTSPNHVTLMKEALRYSETSVHTRATRRNIPEDAILRSHRSENLKSFIVFNLLCQNIHEQSPH
jgi:hypothetical protein